MRLSRPYQAGPDARREAVNLPAADPRRPALAATARRGEQARRTMVESNLRLVVPIAWRYAATRLPLADLVQEGNLGLLRRWRSSTGARASSSPRTRPVDPAGDHLAGPADRRRRRGVAGYLEDSQAIDPGELAAAAAGQEALARPLRTLPERAWPALVLRFGLDSGAPRTLEQLGAVMGFSRERARQLERKALPALRSPEIRARLEDLLAA